MTGQLAGDGGSEQTAAVSPSAIEQSVCRLRNLRKGRRAHGDAERAARDTVVHDRRGACQLQAHDRLIVYYISKAPSLRIRRLTHPRREAIGSNPYKDTSDTRGRRPAECDNGREKGRHEQDVEASHAIGDEAGEHAAPEAGGVHDRNGVEGKLVGHAELDGVSRDEEERREEG